jgi:type VI protein secretion system component Hcp
LGYRLEHVQVTSFTVSPATTGSAAPVEKISLNYEEITVTY